MTTLVQAIAAFKARITDPTYKPTYTQNGDTFEMLLKWQDDDQVLPSTPAPFVFFEIHLDRAGFAAFGGGRGQNLQRNTGELNGYVMVPRGWGLETMAGYAELIATAFRSYRSNDISCFEASIMPIGEGAQLVPPGLSQQDGFAGNYACILCSVEFFYDQVG